MHYHYPTPAEVGIKTPPDLIRERFDAGFQHGLKGGQLDHIEYFRRSFRLGFRASKLYLREYRRRKGILTFPVQGRMRFRAYY